jgi:tRNA modification GTPase
VEAEGVRRARARAEAADLRLWVRAPGDPPGEAEGFVKPRDLMVLTKADLDRAAPPQDRPALAVSAVTGEGMGALHDWLATRLAADMGGADFPPVTRERHRVRLSEALFHVKQAQASLGTPELAGESLRRAALALGRVTGEIGVEDVLGEVFASFCIGK